MSFSDSSVLMKIMTMTIMAMAMMTMTMMTMTMMMMTLMTLMTMMTGMRMPMMTVIIQRRDKRLREEFLRLPAPPGIGYKSSRILGLEESYLQVIK